MKTYTATIQWTAQDMNPRAMQKIFGGEIVGGEWKAPRTLNNVPINVRDFDLTPDPLTEGRIEIGIEIREHTKEGTK